MSTTLIIIIGIIVVAVILIAWFSKSMYDLAEEVSEKKAERRHRQRLLHDISMWLHEEELRSSQPLNKNRPYPYQGADPRAIEIANIYASGVAAEQQIAERMNIARQQEDDFKRASTGIEFGGNSPDLNLNPMAHNIVDEMMDSGAHWNDSFADDIGMTDPFPDSWDNGYSSDPGFDSMNPSGFDPFNGF